MTTSQLELCVLSGGAGSRLWPISREMMPKQFYDLAGRGKPLLIETLDRLSSLGRLSVLTSERLVYPTQGLLNRYGTKAEVLGEPCRRNTAAAVAYFTHRTLRCSASDTVIGIFPSDHLIAKPEIFSEVIRQAADVARQGFVVTCGIRPTHASDAYGYIELATKVQAGSAVAQVKKFVEKPSITKAEEFLATERFVWNAGMFVFRADTMAKHFETHMPLLWKGLSALKADESNLAEVFEKLPSESLDYGIMEKLTDIRCVVADMGWSDIGSWEEVAEHSPRVTTPIEIEGGSNEYLPFNVTPKKAAFVGVSDIELVETGDALLVLRKGAGQKLRDVVKRLEKDAPALLVGHTFEERPWGRFEVLHDTDYFKSKKITVWAGQKLSYQSHTKRAEHWVVVKGQAEVTLNGEIHRLGVGQHVHIPLGAKHRIANPGPGEMEFIEVQTGTYFGEDDITRYSDDYGRK
jgi:mannose-1-phosphate guanylyltransferase/mannose-6-phosphate isomerase